MQSATDGGKKVDTKKSDREIGNFIKNLNRDRYDARQPTIV